MLFRESGSACWLSFKNLLCFSKHRDCSLVCLLWPKYFTPLFAEAIVSSGKTEKSPHDQEIKFFAKVSVSPLPKISTTVV